MPYMMIFLVVYLVFFSMFIFFGIKIIPEGTWAISERLGSYHQTLGAGLHFIFPFIDRVAYKVTKAEQILSFTYENREVTMRYQVVDPKLYFYGVKTPIKALETLITDTIDEEKFENIQLIASEKATVWGIQVNKLKIK